jgi:hypothetical protein
MRARNNLAAALGDDEPARATRLVIETMDLAREVGARGMYNWQVAVATLGLKAEGRDWDAHLERMREASETATIRGDRVRLRSSRGMMESARGEGLDQIGPELAEIIGDSAAADDRFLLLMATGYAALMSGDADTAYRKGMDATRVQTQTAEGGANLALRAAIWNPDPERIRVAALAVEEGPSTGAEAQAFRAGAAGAVAAVDGRTAEAVAALRDAVSRLAALDQHFDAAEMAVFATILLPSHPEIRRLAEEHRPLLEELRARPYLERLDAALAAESSPAPSRTAAVRSVEASTS